MKPVIAIIIISILLYSCMVMKNDLNPGHDFNKEVTVKDISFFGRFNYATGERSKYDPYYQVLYKNDSLKYISTGKKKYTKNSQVWEVIHLSDTINILVRQSDGPRYLMVDTLIFFRDECYTKRVAYQTTNFAGVLPVDAEFERHVFDTAYYMTDERYNYPDTIDARKSVKDYIAECRLRQPGQGPEKAHHTWRSYEVSRDSVMLMFFRGHFF